MSKWGRKVTGQRRRLVRDFKAYAIENNLTNVDLSQLTGIHHATIGGWFRGEHLPVQELAEKAALLLTIKNAVRSTPEAKPNGEARDVARRILAQQQAKLDERIARYPLSRQDVKEREARSLNAPIERPQHFCPHCSGPLELEG